MWRHHPLAVALGIVLTLVLLVVACAPAVQPTPTAAVPPTATRPLAASPTPVSTPRPGVPTATASGPTPTPFLVATAQRPGTPTPSGETVRYGGVLLRTGGDPPSFDLHQETTGSVVSQGAPAYNSLLRYDPTDPGMVIIGELARTWTVSQDGRVITFNLVQGVKWQDGQPLTAEDVVYSLKRIQSPPEGVVSPRKVWLEGVIIEAPDASTVRLTLPQPKAALLPQIATDWWAIMPKHILEKQKDMRSTIMGSGPYMQKSYNRAISQELVKNPNYWVPGKPYLDGIKFVFISDPATSLAALITGRVHTRGLVGGITPTEGRNILKTQPKIVVSQVPSYIWDIVYINNQRPPFADVRVRRAVDLAIDRDLFIKVGAEEAGAIGYLMPSPPQGPWGLSVDELVKLPGRRQPKDQDRATAKSLLAEAGYPNGFQTALSFRDSGAAYERRAVVVKDQLANIGINASLRPLEAATVFTPMGKHDFDILVFRDAATMDDPDEFLQLYYRSNSAKNWGDFRNPEVDRLLDEQSGAVDPAKRKALVEQAQRRMIELVPSAHINWVVYWSAWWPAVKGVFPRPTLYAFNRQDFVWLAE